MNELLFYVTFYSLMFIIGSIIGSFLKVVADRIVLNKPIFLSRSECFFCNKKLKPINLIPIVSFLFLRGKCFNCKKNISILYPISEIITGSLFLYTAIYFNIINNINIINFIKFLYVLVIISFFVIMIFSDLSYYIIPNKIVYIAISISFLFLTFFLFYQINYLFNQINASVLGKYLIQTGYLKIQIMELLKSYFGTIISSLIIFLFFLLLVIITNGKGMGGGDVKLAFLIGLFNEFPYNVLAIFLGFVFGSIISLILLALKLKTIKDIIPFGPFLVLGSIVALFYGRQILNWYLGLM